MGKLLYMKGNYEVYTTPFEFSYIRGLEQYKGQKLRNKVVLKISLDKVICEKYYLTKKSSDEYSSFLMSILTGLIFNGETTPSNLQLFYKEDLKFRRYLAELYYTKYSIYEGDPSFMGLIIQELGNNLKREINIFRRTTEGSYSILYENCTGTDLYLAVEEEMAQTIVLDSKYEVEVVSDAKNWVGRIQYRN